VVVRGSLLGQLMSEGFRPALIAEADLGALTRSLPAAEKMRDARAFFVGGPTNPGKTPEGQNVEPLIPAPLIAALAKFVWAW
jgi:hypothetical protein